MDNIRIARTDSEIEACYPVMQALRPHIAADEFIGRVRRQEEAGYRLAFLDPGQGPAAVAGFRFGENLAWGPFMYVDDLVTLPALRSRGYGAQLLSWLKGHAAENGCRQLHLDSGAQREAAHRFYEREAMVRTGFHFAVGLERP